MTNLQVGDTVSYLELLEKTPRSSAMSDKVRNYWTCKCVCGAVVTRREDLFVEGKVMSCGCKHPSKAERDQCRQWKGVGQLGSQYFSSIRCRAIKLGIPFEIDMEYVWNLFVEQNQRCALTGLPLKFVTQRRRRKTGERQTASLDRIDSNLGYVKGNVWWVDAEVNIMKNAYPLDRFLRVCDLVTSYYLSKNPLSPSPDKTRTPDPAPDMQTAA